MRISRPLINNKIFNGKENVLDKKKLLKHISIGIIIILLGGGAGYIIRGMSKVINQEEAPKEKVIWGEKSASDFIKEKNSYNPLEGMITDGDCDWIDVDGLRKIFNGNAALITDRNRDWIGKEMVGEAVVIPSGQWEEYQEEMAEKSKNWKKERIERILSSDYISSIDDEMTYLPWTVNSFASEEKDGEYITPEVIFGNGAMIIFTKPDGTGWKLNKGQSIEFQAEQYELERENASKGGQQLYFGYICDGRYYKGTEDGEMLHCYSKVADKDGEYFITIISTSSIITLKNGYVGTNNIE